LKQASNKTYLGSPLAFKQVQMSPKVFSNRDRRSNTANTV